MENAKIHRKRQKSRLPELLDFQNLKKPI